MNDSKSKTPKTVIPAIWQPAKLILEKPLILNLHVSPCHKILQVLKLKISEKDKMLKSLKPRCNSHQNLHKPTAELSVLLILWIFICIDYLRFFGRYQPTQEILYNVAYKRILAPSTISVTSSELPLLYNC